MKPHLFSYICTSIYWVLVLKDLLRKKKLTTLESSPSSPFSGVFTRIHAPCACSGIKFNVSGRIHQSNHRTGGCIGFNHSCAHPDIFLPVFAFSFFTGRVRGLRCRQRYQQMVARRNRCSLPPRINLTIKFIGWVVFRVTRVTNVVRITTTPDQQPCWKPRQRISVAVSSENFNVHLWVQRIDLS